jgi:hypothetical protein
MQQIAVGAVNLHRLDPDARGALGRCDKGIAYPCHLRQRQFGRWRLAGQLRQSRGSKGLPAALRRAQQLPALPRQRA